MTPDLYGAWLAAGDRLQPAGAWLAGWWPLLAAALLLTVIGWALWPARGDYRSRNDQAAAWAAVDVGARPEPGQPGVDAGLYLDCVAIYGDCDDLDRLRDAIEQHRTGEK